MKKIGHIHLDAVGGIAGDMFVAALLDARPDLQIRVFDDIAALIPDDVGQAVLCQGLSGGIAARRFMLEETHPAHDSHAGHDHRDCQHHGHHEHSHDGSFAALVRRIEAACLHPGTGIQAVGILRRLAEAESKMHRVPVEEVHFHEIAAWDSLMDVVAAGSLVAALAGFSWSVSALPTGRGLVKTQHGLLPVPAPATAELLRGFSWRDDGAEGERVTPTGAAILAHLIDPGLSAHAKGRLLCAGTGAGSRDIPGLPNILRALVFQPPEAEAGDGGNEIVVLSFDIDDMSGEEIGIAAQRLRANEGVLDLGVGSRLGKKGRPVADFRLLVVPQFLAAVSRRCFAETSTIGLRWHIEQRLCLAREAVSVDHQEATLRCKRVARPDGTFTCKVESDDLESGDSLVERRRVKHCAERKGVGRQ